MKTDAYHELQRRIAPGKSFYPRFSAILESCAGDVELERGVLLLGHTPSIAPKAYCCNLYPPILNTGDALMLNGRQVPHCLCVLLTMMNGATLFWGSVEIWGLITDDDKWRQPAFDIENESRNEQRGDAIAFASTSCGDTAWLNINAFTIDLIATDVGLPRQTFASIDEWLKYEKALADETLL